MKLFIICSIDKVLLLFFKLWLKVFGVVKMGGFQLPWDTDIDMAMAKSEWGDMARIVGLWKSKWGFGAGFKIY